MEPATGDANMAPGTVLLSEARTNAIILHPQPTDDPNDPLNWSALRKGVNFGIVCFYTLFTFVELDISSVAYYELVEDIGFTYQLSTIATAVNYAALAAGSVLFLPLVYRYGRRPIYLVSLVLQFAAMIWSAKLETNGEIVAVNVISGLGGAINETIVQITIADMFFVHQYATMNGIFLFMQTAGAYLGPVAAGYVVVSQGWRWMWWWCTIFIGISLVVVLFLFEESTYMPVLSGQASSEPSTEQVANKQFNKEAGDEAAGLDRMVSRPPLNTAIPQHPLRQRLALITRTEAPLWHHLYQPVIILFRFPAVMYAALTYGSVLAWFSVLISIASTQMGYPPYNFGSVGIGLLNIAPFVGSLLGSILISPLSDWMIVRLARRNGGIYEPEMRLWPAIPGAFLVSGGVLMFGIGIAHTAPWPLLAVGFGIYGFGFVVCVDIALSYLTDSYQDIIGDAMVGVIFVRNAVSVVVLFCLEPWSTNMGFQNMFILIAVMGFVILMIPVPLLIWGKKARISNADMHRWYAMRQRAQR